MTGQHVLDFTAGLAEVIRRGAEVNNGRTSKRDDGNAGQTSETTETLQENDHGMEEEIPIGEQVEQLLNDTERLRRVPADILAKWYRRHPTIGSWQQRLEHLCQLRFQLTPKLIKMPMMNGTFGVALQIGDHKSLITESLPDIRKAVEQSCRRAWLAILGANAENQVELTKVFAVAIWEQRADRIQKGLWLSDQWTSRDLRIASGITVLRPLQQITDANQSSKSSGDAEPAMAETRDTQQQPDEIVPGVRIATVSATGARKFSEYLKDAARAKGLSVRMRMENKEFTGPEGVLLYGYRCFITVGNQSFESSEVFQTREEAREDACRLGCKRFLTTGASSTKY